MYVSGAEEIASKGFGFETTRKGVTLMTTPTGEQVALTQEEEKDIAKEALRDKLKLQMTEGYRMKDTVINSVLNAAGYAVGLGIAGLALAFVVKWTGIRKPKVSI